MSARPGHRLRLATAPAGAIDRLEGVTPDEVGDPPTDVGTRHVRVAEVDPAPDPRLDDLVEGLGEAVEVPRLPGVAAAEDVERDPSVPKKSRSVFRTDPLTQPCPDGWSGNGGVLSGGTVGVAGSNNDLQAGSATVAGFPSVSASRIAAIGRQKFQWNLSFQQLIAPSAAARCALPNRRAVATVSRPRLAESDRISPP